MFDLNIVCLAGGVGGAKLAAGLAHIVPSENLTIIVNTGDDFYHMGLLVCPDLDTVMYTLAGVANPETGWGRVTETWRTMTAVKQLAGPDWFSLGDLDLGTHLTRTHLLQEGNTLTAVTRHFCQQLGIQPAILPMSDEPAPTMIESEAETFPFQTWFVKERWQPPVKTIILPENVKASWAVSHALESADIIVIAPSNPFVSIDPILNVYPIRSMIMDLPRVVAAVSPIVGGAAVKGPAAKMMGELGLAVSAEAVAHYYGQLLDVFVYDQQDADSFATETVTAVCTDTMMVDEASRIRVAQEVLQAAINFR